MDARISCLFRYGINIRDFRLKGGWGGWVVDEWRGGWMERWMDGWIDRWVNEWRNGGIYEQRLRRSRALLQSHLANLWL